MRRLLLKAAFILVIVLALSSCERKIGYGVLYWADEERGIPSGAVLPVYVKSNIERLWIIGLPKEYRGEQKGNVKIGVPFASMDVFSSKGKAKKRAKELGSYILTYAETLQDGLPIRTSPDNGAPRTYRLRRGEVIKILQQSEGVPAVGADGAPLPGDWFLVLTEDGTKGYCFSYRLRLFEHSLRDSLSAAGDAAKGYDAEWEYVLSKTWVSEAYETMVNYRRLDLGALLKNWEFKVSEESGQVKFSTPIAPYDASRGEWRDASYSYAFRSVTNLGERDWQLLDAAGSVVLSMSLLDDNRLSVQYNQETGLPRTVFYVNMSASLADLAEQESHRRDALLSDLLGAGRTWRSAFYGTLILDPDRKAVWSGFDMLVPSVFTTDTLPTGFFDFSLFLDPSLEKSYTGVLTFEMNTLPGGKTAAHFLYTINEDGNGELRLEHVPVDAIEGTRVRSRASTARIMYFYSE